MKMAREERIRKSQCQSRNQAIPTISETSRTMRSVKDDLSVVQRLIQYQKLYEGKRLEKQKQLNMIVLLL